MEKERKIGTVVRGLRAPIIREGDDLKKIVLDVLGEIIVAVYFMGILPLLPQLETIAYYVKTLLALLTRLIVICLF